jgi:hypothetical protein
MRSPKRLSSPSSGNRADYRKAFLGHVHKLLHAGYAALTPTDFRTAEEDDITGELCKHMKHLTEVAPSSPWMARYSIHDQDPVNNAKREGDGKIRRGKRRPRLDIRIVSKVRIPNASFNIEAKRLHHSGSTSDYMDDEGLNAFIKEYYAKDDDACGMLGYVQTGGLKEWISKLHLRLTKETSIQPDSSGAGWIKTPLKNPGANIYLSRHICPGSSKKLEVYHTLFLFA